MEPNIQPIIDATNYVDNFALISKEAGNLTPKGTLDCKGDKLIYRTSRLGRLWAWMQNLSPKHRQKLKDIITKTGDEIKNNKDYKKVNNITNKTINEKVQSFLKNNKFFSTIT